MRISLGDEAENDFGFVDSRRQTFKRLCFGECVGSGLFGRAVLGVACDLCLLGVSFLIESGGDLHVVVAIRQQPVRIKFRTQSAQIRVDGRLESGASSVSVPGGLRFALSSRCVMIGALGIDSSWARDSDRDGDDKSEG